MNVDNITNFDLEDVWLWDHPDYCDAFIASADWKDTGEPLTEDELEELNTEHGDLVNQLAHEAKWG